MIKRLIKKYRIWKCKRQFAGLSPRFQELFKTIGVDPESKIKRGDFDRKPEHKIKTTTWAEKSSDDILGDINSAIKSIREGSVKGASCEK